ncbi:MAG: SDR family NAD(P)-dependent oxidoreductase [Solirubrobacterales bacterium]
MPRVFVTGSADGIGRLAAQTLLDDGSEVVVTLATTTGLSAARDLLDRGVAAVVGELPDLEQMGDIASQVNDLGRVDAVIHNVGVYSGPQAMPVNVAARYPITALIDRPRRLIYPSSGAQRNRRPNLSARAAHGSSASTATCPQPLRRAWPP